MTPGTNAMVLPSVVESAARAEIAQANNIGMVGDMARMANKYCLMPSANAAAAFFAALQGGRLPIRCPADSAGVEFRGDLVFILLFLRLLLIGERTKWIGATGERIELSTQPNQKVEGKAGWRKVLIYGRIIVKCARDAVRKPSCLH
jgi:hypothetical protein